MGDGVPSSLVGDPPTRQTATRRSTALSPQRSSLSRGRRVWAAEGALPPLPFSSSFSVASLTSAGEKGPVETKEEPLAGTAALEEGEHGRHSHSDHQGREEERPHPRPSSPSAPRSSLPSTTAKPSSSSTWTSPEGGGKKLHRDASSGGCGQGRSPRRHLSQEGRHEDPHPTGSACRHSPFLDGEEERNRRDERVGSEGRKENQVTAAAEDHTQESAALPGLPIVEEEDKDVVDGFLCIRREDVDGFSPENSLGFLPPTSFSLSSSSSSLQSHTEEEYHTRFPSSSRYPSLGRLGNLFIPRHEYCRRVLWRYEAESGELFLFYPEEISGPCYPRHTLRYTICFYFQLRGSGEPQGVPRPRLHHRPLSTSAAGGEGGWEDEDEAAGGVLRRKQRWEEAGKERCSSIPRYEQQGDPHPFFHEGFEGASTSTPPWMATHPAVRHRVLQPFGLALTQVASALRDAERQHHYMFRQLLQERQEMFSIPPHRRRRRPQNATPHDTREGEGKEKKVKEEEDTLPFVPQQKHTDATTQLEKEKEPWGSRIGTGRALTSVPLPTSGASGVNSFVVPHTPHRWTPLPLLFDILYQRLHGGHTREKKVTEEEAEEEEASRRDSPLNSEKGEAPFHHTPEHSTKKRTTTKRNGPSDHEWNEKEGTNEDTSSSFSSSLSSHGSHDVHPSSLAFAISSSAIPISQHIGFHVSLVPPQKLVAPPSSVASESSSYEEDGPPSSFTEEDQELPSPLRTRTCGEDARPTGTVLCRMMDLNDVVLPLVSSEGLEEDEEEEAYNPFEDLLVRSVRRLAYEKGHRTVADVVFGIVFRTRNTIQEVWNRCTAIVRAMEYPAVEKPPRKRGEEKRKGGGGGRGDRKERKEDIHARRRGKTETQYRVGLVPIVIPLQWHASADGMAPCLTSDEVQVWMHIRLAYTRHHPLHEGPHGSKEPLTAQRSENDTNPRRGGATPWHEEPLPQSPTADHTADDREENKREVKSAHAEESCNEIQEEEEEWRLQKVVLQHVVIRLPPLWQSLYPMVEEALLELEAHQILRRRSPWDPNKRWYRSTTQFQEVLKDAHHPSRWELGYYMFWMSRKRDIMRLTNGEGFFSTGDMGFSSLAQPDSETTLSTPASLVVEIVELIPETDEEASKGEDETPETRSGEHDGPLMHTAHEGTPLPTALMGVATGRDVHGPSAGGVPLCCRETFPEVSSPLASDDLPLPSLGLYIVPSHFDSSSLASSCSSDPSDDEYTCFSSREVDDSTPLSWARATDEAGPPQWEMPAGIHTAGHGRNIPHGPHGHAQGVASKKTRRVSPSGPILCSSAPVHPPVPLPPSFFSDVMEDTDEEDEEFAAAQRCGPRTRRETVGPGERSPSCTTSSSDVSRSEEAEWEEDPMPALSLEGEEKKEWVDANTSQEGMPAHTSITPPPWTEETLPPASSPSFFGGEEEMDGKSAEEVLQHVMGKDARLEVELAAAASLRALSKFHDALSIVTLQKEMRKIIAFRHCFHSWSMDCCQALVEVGLLNNWLQEVKVEEAYGVVGG